MTDEKQAIDAAVEQFRSLMESQLARAKRIREDKDFTDFDALDTILIGICGGRRYRPRHYQGERARAVFPTEGRSGQRQDPV